MESTASSNNLLLNLITLGIGIFLLLFSPLAPAWAANFGNPVVAAISPSMATWVDGSIGARVDISGVGLTGATMVKFGQVGAPSFRVAADSLIVARPPYGVDNTVDVTVITPRGTSIITPLDRFTYVTTPVIMRVSPSSGAVGKIITVYGHGFKGVREVTLDPQGSNGGAAAFFKVISDKRMTVDVPTGKGTVDVNLGGPGVVSAVTPQDRFVYVAGNVGPPRNTPKADGPNPWLDLALFLVVLGSAGAFLAALVLAVYHGVKRTGEVWNFLSLALFLLFVFVWAILFFTEGKWPQTTTGLVAATGALLIRQFRLARRKRLAATAWPEVGQVGPSAMSEAKVVSPDPVQGEKISLWVAPWRVLFYPADTFARLPERPKLFWILLGYSFLTLVGVILDIPRGAFSSFSYSAVLAPSVLDFVIAVIIVVGLGLTLLFSWLGWILVSLGLYLIGLPISGKRINRRQWYIITVFASLPMVVYLLLSGLFRHIFPEIPLGIVFTNQRTLVSVLAFYFLNPFSLWSLVITSIGYVVYSGIKRWKAGAVVVVAWAIGALALAGSNAMGNAAGFYPTPPTNLPTSQRATVKLPGEISSQVSCFSQKPVASNLVGNDQSQCTAQWGGLHGSPGLGKIFLGKSLNAAFSNAIGFLANKDDEVIGCPLKLAGAVQGSMVPITVYLVGPQGVVSFQAAVDTGAQTSYFPEAALQAAGYIPAGITYIAGVTGGALANYYQIPANSIQILNRDRLAPISRSGVIFSVSGARKGQLFTGLIGEDILNQGAAFSLGSNGWSLTLPCSLSRG